MADHSDPSYTYAVATAQEEGQGEEKTALIIKKSDFDVAFLFYYQRVLLQRIFFRLRHYSIHVNAAAAVGIVEEK